VDIRVIKPGPGELFQPIPVPDGPADPATNLLTRARAFVSVSAAHRASLVAMQEWKARGPAAALAASLGVPLVDAVMMEVLTAREALASLPTTEIADTPRDDVSVSVSLQPWAIFHDFEDRGRYWAVSDGMHRFGLPELRAGCGGRDLRDLPEELKEILFGVAFRLWSDLLMRAQATPGAVGLTGMPGTLQIPVEMDIHRKDLDRARGAPNRGGAWTTIGLRLDQGPARGRTWLTICPPSGGDMDWDRFEASRAFPGIRRRFMVGELPPGSV
jgi:hypothetical protein